MKNLILISFLFIAFQSNAQTTKPIDGFLGVKFGSTTAQVTEALKAKGLVLNTDYKQAESLLFNNVSLGSKKFAGLYVKFIGDKVYEGQFNLIPDLEPKAIEYYNALVNDINGVYGPGKSSKKFRQPYSDGDGYEITAIKSGNADYATYWLDGDNYIYALIKLDSQKNIIIKLYYDDGKLLKVFDEQQKAKNKSEF